MNENLKDLKQKAKQLFRDKNWNELIAVCTEIIELEQEPHEKARAYVQRGIAYLQKRDPDQAIADFNEALKRKEDYAEAYRERGVAYSLKGDLDQAIPDFNEAIKRKDNYAEAYYNLGVAYLQKDDFDQAIANFTEVLRINPSDAEAYYGRGVTYFQKGDPDQAIADFNKTLGLQLDDTVRAKVYLNRGFAYNLKRNFDQSIEDFTRTLELLPTPDDNPVAGVTYLGRGVAYIEKGSLLDGFNDFKKADKCYGVLKSEYPGIYIASKIAEIFKGSDEGDKGRVFELYLRLLEAILKIQKKLFYAPQENAEVAHYTSLYALKSLANKGLFRLYNAAYMNDPGEGRVFFEIMKSFGIEDMRKVFYEDEDPSYPSPVYIGSFFKVDEQDEEKDMLFMWRTYGKHDGQEAAGASLIFKHEGTVFAEKCSAQIGTMQQFQLQLLSTGAPSNPEERQPPKPDLYEIVYGDKKSEQKLSEELKELAKSLKQIKEHVSKEKDDNSKKKLKRLAHDLLDTIRFLFKARHYSEEREVRMVQVRYYDEKNTTQEEDGIQVDTERIPPRYYLETHANFCFSEVILGPQARGVPEWKRWLKEQDETLIVTKSKIEYGTQYP